MFAANMKIFKVRLMDQVDKARLNYLCACLGRCASCDLEDAVANAEKCIQCNGPLLALVREVKQGSSSSTHNHVLVKNDWSGEVLTKAAGTIHVECESDYRIASAPKCGACNLPVLKGNGFSGKARRTRKGLVHLECMHKV